LIAGALRGSLLAQVIQILGRTATVKMRQRLKWPIATDRVQRGLPVGHNRQNVSRAKTDEPI